MKEESKTKLQETATELLDFVNTSKDFVLEQTPLYVQEVVEFHFLENAISAGLNLVIAIVTLLVITFASYKIYKKDTSNWDVEWFVVALIAILSAMILIVSGEYTTKYSKECYKAKYAPRVLIIEKLTELRR